jgi:hypothetical protein
MAPEQPEFKLIYNFVDQYTPFNPENVSPALSQTEHGFSFRHLKYFLNKLKDMDFWPFQTQEPIQALAQALAQGKKGLTSATLFCATSAGQAERYLDQQNWKIDTTRQKHGIQMNVYRVAPKKVLTLMQAKP